MATKYKKHPLRKVPANVLNVNFSDEIWDTINDEYREQNPSPYNFNLSLTMDMLLIPAMYEELKKYGVTNIRYCPTCMTVMSTDDFFPCNTFMCKKCLCHHNRAKFNKNWVKVVHSTDGKCISCGDPFEHVHHIIPKSFGGTDDYDNLVPLCKQCHNLAHKYDYDLKRGINKDFELKLKIFKRELELCQDHH